MWASDSEYEYMMWRRKDTVKLHGEEAYNRHKEVEIIEAAQRVWDKDLDPDMDRYDETLKILSEEMRFDYVRKKTQ